MAGGRSCGPGLSRYRPLRFAYCVLRQATIATQFRASQKICPKCSWSNGRNAKFCSECGAPLNLTAIR
ncbi:MAG: zinc-ribbon domain-containing protein [Acidiferrobacteraceae bacterium]